MIHTRIDKPLELRRDLLEAAIDSTEILKSYQKLKQLDEDRKGLKIEAKTLLKELSGTTLNFEKLLPGLPEDFLKVEEENSPIVLDISKDINFGREFKSKGMAPQNRLDKEIEEIRRKIASLRHRI